MLTLSGRVKETQQVLATQFSFRLRTPDLIMKVSQTIQLENSTAKEIKIYIYILFLCFVFLLSRSQSGRPWSGRRWQWRSRSLTHSHRCWRRWYSTWKDWACKLLAQFITGKEADQTSCRAHFFLFKLPCISCMLTVISCLTLRDIGSRASVSLTEHFVPTLPGPRKLLASLNCRQLTQVHGVVDIRVEDKSDAAR